MAALHLGGQYVVTATAVNVTDAFSLDDPPGHNKYLKRLSIKNADDATAAVYIGNSDVTNVPANAHIELGAGQSYDFYSGDGWLIANMRTST